MFLFIVFIVVFIYLLVFIFDYSMVILFWDLVFKGYVNGEFLGYKVVVNGFDNILFVVLCFLFFEFNDVNVLSDMCI